MRYPFISLALASSFLAAPAYAREGALYVEGQFGPMLVEDIDFDIGSIDNAATLDSKWGFDGGGLVGYDFGPFRVEAEASYRRAKFDTISFDGNTEEVTGRSSVLSFMLNGLADFGADDGLQGFVGGGVGVGRVKFRSPGLIDDDDRRFAWQALAGVRAPLTDNIDVGLRYRFFNVHDARFIDTTGDAVRGNWRSHSILGTIAFNLGGRAEEVLPPPPPPPEPLPPPPPPPPPPPVAMCNKGPYIVFFDWDRSDITAEAATILESAVGAYGSCDRVPVMVAGYTDRSGSPAYNQGLSERRAGSVRGYLSTHGVPDSAITTQGFGESNNRVPTADGVRELQNRRVEITYGPGSGM